MMKNDPTKSLRKLANDTNADVMSTSKVVHDDLALKSIVRTPRNILSDSMNARRL